MNDDVLRQGIALATFALTLWGIRPELMEVAGRGTGLVV